MEPHVQVEKLAKESCGVDDRTKEEEESESTDLSWQLHQSWRMLENAGSKIAVYVVCQRLILTNSCLVSWASNRVVLWAAKDCHVHSRFVTEAGQKVIS